MRELTNTYLQLSSRNIAAVQGCVLNGDAACVQTLEAQAASTAEVSGILPFGYGDNERQFAARQNNVNNYGSVRGADALFESDVQQAQEIAQFRQQQCGGLSASACDSTVRDALNDRLVRVGALGAISAGVPLAVRGVQGLTRRPGVATSVVGPTSDAALERSAAPPAQATRARVEANVADSAAARAASNFDDPVAGLPQREAAIAADVKTPPPTVPAKVVTVVDYVANNNGAAPPGYVGGRTFMNDGRGNGQTLPSADAAGTPISYREYDVNARQPGVNRGTERIVIGSDGSAYYTNDHYTTFTRIKP